MKILAIDCESTGLLEDPSCKATEVAWAVWDTDLDRMISSRSYTVNSLKEGEEISKEITELTGITTQQVRDHGVSAATMCEDVGKQMLMADYVMARNAPFDKGLLFLEFNRLEMNFPPTPWICTKMDVEYPEYVKGRTQSHIAADHGFVNPFPHWAMGDVLTMLRIHQVGKYGWGRVCELAASPMIRVTANVEYQERELAKDVGFNWNPQRKIWFKDIKKLKFEEERSEYKFEYFLEEL